MTMKRFRATEACRIAGIHRDRFNEAVAAGNYPCAPPVVRGSARVFDEEALMALFYYGRLLDRGYLASVAGHLACLFHGQLHIQREAAQMLAAHPEGFLAKKTRAEFESRAAATCVVIYASLGGRRHAALQSDVKLNESVDGGPIMDQLVISIEPIRTYVRSEMEEEAAILGSED